MVLLILIRRGSIQYSCFRDKQEDKIIRRLTVCIAKFITACTISFISATFQVYNYTKCGQRRIQKYALVRSQFPYRWGYFH